MKTKLAILITLALASQMPAATGDVKGLTVVQASGGSKALTVAAPAAGDILGFTGTAASQLTKYGTTTAGRNILNLTNPGAVTFLRINADNTVTARSAAELKTDQSLNLVENTALSTWAGSANLTTGAGGLFGTAAYATAADFMPKSGSTFTGHILFTDNTFDIGASGATRPRTGYFGTKVFSPKFEVATSVHWTSGTGSPEGAVTANIGSLYSQTDGGTDTTFWRKESGTGNTGWVAVAASAGGSVATDAIWDAAGDIVRGTGSNTAGRLGMGTALQVLRVNAGATDLEWAAASGNMATDPLWDAAGDLAVGTGANTGAKLSMGTALQVLRVNAGATALEYAAAGGDVAGPASSTDNAVARYDSTTGKIIQDSHLYVADTSGFSQYGGTSSSFPALLPRSVISVNFTVTIANPGVFTSTAHGLSIGDPVGLTTTGALPTGLAIGPIYFVHATSFTANTFTLSATLGGVTIQTSGTQSGTHTVQRAVGFRVRTADNLSHAQLSAGVTFVEGLVVPTGTISVGTTQTGSQINVYEGQSSTKTQYQQGTGSGGLHIISGYTDDNYLPGVIWSTDTNNATKTKGAIFMQVDDSTGAWMFLSTTNSFATGANNDGIVIDPAGRVCMGHVTPAARLHPMSTTEQVRTAYDASNYESTTVSSAGAVTRNAVGASQAFAFSDPVAVTGALTGTAAITSSGATSGIGYATGAGGTVTQLTDRVTGVTLNKVCGTITTHNASLAALGAATFTVTNSAVAIGDVVTLAVRSGLSNVTTHVHVTTVAAGSFNITVHNLDSVSAETGAIIINFSVIKAVTS